MAQRLLLALLWRLLKVPRCMRSILIKPLIWLLSRTKLARICEDMSSIFNALSVPEINALARLSIANVAANMVNILDIKKDTYRINSPIPIAQLTDSGAVFASIHMGKTDSVAYALKQSGVQVCTMIGAGRHSPVLHQLGVRTLQYLGIDYIKKSATTFFQLAHRLSQGQSVFIHSDLKNEGQEVSFLGFQTTIPKTAASLSVLAKKPLYFIYVLPSERKYEYVVNIELVEDLSALELSGTQKIEQLSHALALKMEKTILQNPAQWFWLYNRFKNCRIK